MSNSNKPIGANVNPNLQNTVGKNYEERRKLSHQRSLVDTPIRISKFGANPYETQPSEAFQSNAQYVAGRKTLPHQVVESGRGHLRPTHLMANDKTRIAYLDSLIFGKPKAIAASADNNAPAMAPKVKKAF